MKPQNVIGQETRTDANGGPADFNINEVGRAARGVEIISVKVIDDSEALT